MRHHGSISVDAPAVPPLKVARKLDLVAVVRSLSAHVLERGRVVEDERDVGEEHACRVSCVSSGDGPQVKNAKRPPSMTRASS